MLPRHPRRPRRLAAVAFALLPPALAPAAAADPGDPKQVIAGAADVASGALRLPEPGSVLTHSRTAWFPIELAPGAEAEVELSVGVAGPLSIVALSPDAAAWRIRARVEGGAWQRLDRAAGAGLVRRETGPAGAFFPGVVADRYHFESAPAGRWTFRVGGAPGAAGGALFVADASPMRLAAHLTTYELFDDADIGIAAFVHDASRPGSPPAQVAVERALAHVAVDGVPLRIPFSERGDGTLEARLPRGLTGDVRARVELAGRDALGRPFVRTATLAFPAIERAARLTGGVREETTPAGSLRVLVGVELERAGARLHASAELWGTGAAGEAIPVAWLSSIRPAVSGGGGHAALFEIPAGLPASAGAGAPLELRAVRIQDPGTHLPFDRLARVPLEGSPAAAAPGGSVAPHGSAVAPADPIPRALMLVHGYCSEGVWPTADFTPPFEVFLDPDQNRTNDEFAQLLADFGEDQGLASFGVVAHSQGGLAALHLYTYYESGLDHASGGRRIQSVGSPYLGTPLAPLGDVVPGVGCGANFDMGPDGAALWLAGIPNEARAEVHHWTTSETSFFACNVFTGFLLDDPEDGVVEMAAGQLPGGVSQGHTLGWCHSTDMSEEAHYLDPVRNAEMDAEAAR